MRIAILVPVCSRNQPWKTIDECFWLREAWPALQKTLDSHHTYTVYIGIDDDDEFFLKQQDRLEGKIVLLHGCHHAPAWAWNQLFDAAIQDGHDYFFQMADDVVLETPKWTDTFIRKLEANGNLGVIGPCNLDNYNGRLLQGKTPVIENAFVHRRHHEIFGYFFPPQIKNWYCDDWITEVYANHLSNVCIYIPIRNLSTYQANQRYAIESPNWKPLLEETQNHLTQKLRGCFSFCLYGPYTDKYYRGMLENIQIIHEHFPTWKILLYGTKEATDYIHALHSDVEIHETPYQGVENTLYRFLPVNDTRFDIVCVRDTDSRIHERDRWCIAEFLKRPSRVYTIRDHPWHKYRMMCGLWGCKRLPNTILQGIEGFIQNPTGYTTDASFLESKVYSNVKKDMVVFCYRNDGLFEDPEECIRVIECPGQFCGNVMLYNPNPYYEFESIHTCASTAHTSS